MTLKGPLLDSEMWWTGELWLQTNLINWQKWEKSIFFLCEKNNNKVFRFFEKKILFEILNFFDIFLECFFFHMCGVFLTFCFWICKFFLEVIRIFLNFLRFFYLFFYFISFLRFLGLFWKSLRLLLNFTDVTTKHQKWPKISTNSVIGFFCPNGKQNIGQRRKLSAVPISKPS